MKKIKQTIVFAAVGMQLIFTKCAFAANIDTGLKVGKASIISAALSQFSGIMSALTALTIASGALAIVLAVVRGIVFNSDSTNAATFSRIIRVLILVAIICAMATLITWVLSQLGSSTTVKSGVNALK